MKIQLPEFVQEILKKFSENNYEIYVVGGAVRDLLTGRSVDDWDFTTSATPEEILKIFPDGFYDNEFGTVGVRDASSTNPYEITTFRKEFGYSDARSPDRVEWGKTLKEDMARRDFTINAMAREKLKAVPQHEIVDLFGGQKD